MHGTRVASTVQPYATRGATSTTPLAAVQRCNRPASALPLHGPAKQVPRGARPASAQLRAGAGAAGNLGEVSLALSNDLEEWQRKWDLALQAVDDLRCSVADAEPTGSAV